MNRLFLTKRKSKCPRSSLPWLLPCSLLPLSLPHRHPFRLPLRQWLRLQPRLRPWLRLPLLPRKHTKPRRPPLRKPLPLPLLQPQRSKFFALYAKAGWSCLFSRPQLVQANTRKNPPDHGSGGFFIHYLKRPPRRPRASSDYASAFRAAARRLLWRAALFLWIIFLSAMLSMVDTDAWKIDAAAALSPAWIALRTALIAVRRVERWAELCAFCLTA